MNELRWRLSCWWNGVCPMHKITTRYFENGECLHCEREAHWKQENRWLTHIEELGQKSAPCCQGGDPSGPGGVWSF